MLNKRKTFAEIMKENKPPTPEDVKSIVGSAVLEKEDKGPVSEVVPVVVEYTAKPEVKLGEEGRTPIVEKKERKGSVEQQEKREGKVVEKFDLVDLSFKYSKEVDYDLDDLVTKLRRESNTDKNKGFYTKKRVVLMGIMEMLKKNGLQTKNIEDFINGGLR